jgi:Ala-tRNA(Pro) deacylase
MAIAKTVSSLLADLAVDYDLISHTRSVSTHESAESAHVPEDHVAKAVIVKDASGFAMVIIPGSSWLRLEALDEETGRQFRLADEREVDILFPDCRPGAVPPVGPAYAMETFLDEGLTTLANVYFEAGDHEHLVHVGSEAFLTLLKGVRRGHFSHEN